MPLCSASPPLSPLPQVIVLERCSTGETLCTNYKCTVQGKCADGATVSGTGASGTGGTSSIVSVPPSIELVTSSGTIGASITITQGYVYDTCVKNQIPTTALPCEPGTHSWDYQGTNLTNRVYSCPPLTCMTSCTGCYGHEFSSKGVASCLDTSAAFNTLFRIRFVTCDLQNPPMLNYVDRMVTIVSPCSDPTPYLCSGLCYAVPCGASLGTAVVAEGAVTLTLTLGGPSTSLFTFYSPPPPPSPPIPSTPPFPSPKPPSPAYPFISVRAPGSYPPSPLPPMPSPPISAPPSAYGSSNVSSVTKAFTTTSSDLTILVQYNEVRNMQYGYTGGGLEQHNYEYMPLLRTEGHALPDTS